MLKQNRKELVGNLLSLGAIDTIALLIPIITLPLLTQKLGAEAYSVYVLIVTILSLGHTVVDFGVNFAGVREVTNKENLNSPHLQSIVYSKYQIVRAFALCVYFFFSSLYVGFILGLGGAYLLLVFLYLVGYLLSSQWYLIALGYSRILLKVSVISRLVPLIYIVFFLEDKNDLLVLLATTCLPILFSGLFLTMFLLKNFDVKFNFTFNGLVQTFAGSLNIFIGVVVHNLYTAIPLLYLGGNAQTIEFAKYAIAVKVSGLITTGQNVISKSLFPIIAKSDNRTLAPTLALNVMVGGAAFLFIYFLGEFFLSIFVGDNFAGGAYLKILVAGNFFVGVSQSFSSAFFIKNDLDAIYRNVAISISLANMVISMYLIYEYEFFGSAIGLTISRFNLAVGYWLAYRYCANRLGYKLS